MHDPVQQLRHNSGLRLTEGSCALTTIATVKTWFVGVFFGIVLLSLTGCATYGKGIQAARADITAQRWEAADLEVTKSLSTQGPDQLLYYLERGMVKHLMGDFSASNQFLETAYGLMDPLDRSPWGDQLKAVASSPRQNRYRGSDFERAMVGFVKIVNDLNLATQSTSEASRQQFLRDARVEARRIRLALERQEDDAEAPSGNQSPITKLVSEMMARDDIAPIPPSSVPLFDWLTALVYEMLGETDDARIAAQQALVGYAQGLDHSTPPSDLTQLWMPMSSKTGQTGDVVVMQMSGLVPQQHEFSIFIGFSGVYQSLSFSPRYQNDGREWEQSLWFNTAVSGSKKHGPWAGYAAGRSPRNSGFQSQVTVSHVTPQVFESGSLLQDALFKGFRVPISYYDSRDYGVRSRSELLWSEGSISMPTSLSVARKAMQDHADNAWQSFYLAFARELAQQMVAETVYQSTKNDDNQLVNVFGTLTQFGAALGAQADTRSWLTLPRDVQMVRLRLPVGRQMLTLSTQYVGGNAVQLQTIVVDVKPQQVQFVSLYTPHSGETH